MNSASVLHLSQGTHEEEGYLVLLVKMEMEAAGSPPLHIHMRAQSIDASSVGCV